MPKISTTAHFSPSPQPATPYAENFNDGPFLTVSSTGNSNAENFNDGPFLTVFSTGHSICRKLQRRPIFNRPLYMPKFFTTAHSSPSPKVLGMTKNCTHPPGQLINPPSWVVEQNCNGPGYDQQLHPPSSYNKTASTFLSMGTCINH
jgi:hypothetical protein